MNNETKGGLVPHYKCEACKARLHVPGKPAELVGELCPGCGCLMEPVTELTQLVGYRYITSRDRAAVAPLSEPHRRLADLLVARRASILERDRLEAERCFDDSNEPAAVALALPVPRTYV